MNLSGKRGVVYVPKYNVAPKKCATGAFHPEGKEFAKRHGFDYVVIDNGVNNARKPAARFKDLLADLRKRDSLDAVAFFCHGFRSGIQFGATCANATMLAQALTRAADGGDELIVALYACDAARNTNADKKDDLRESVGGDGGFADVLRDSLCRAGRIHCQVDAHAKEGHTTENPHVRRFSGEGSALGGNGGGWIVRPGSAAWGTWCKALKGDLRLDFPFLTVAQIHDHLFVKQ